MGRLILLNDRQSGKTTSLLENFFRNQSEEKKIIVLNQEMKQHLKSNYIFSKDQVLTINEFNHYVDRMMFSQIDKTDIYIDELFFMQEREAAKFFNIIANVTNLKNIKVFSTLDENLSLRQTKTIKKLCDHFNFDCIDFRKNKKVKEVEAWGM